MSGPETRRCSVRASAVVESTAGKSTRELIVPGFRDIRGYQAMYRDFVRSVRMGRQPEMSLERAMEDQKLMEDVYAEAGQLA